MHNIKSHYEVWYQRSIRTFPEIPDHLTYRQLVKQYCFVRSIDDITRSLSLEDVYTMMQSDRWGTRIETHDLIAQLPTKHTSMDYQDLIYDTVAGVWYICDAIGFKLIDVRDT